jgi:hypothetical protein
MMFYIAFFLMKDCENATQIFEKGIFCHKFLFFKSHQITIENCVFEKGVTTLMFIGYTFKSSLKKSHQ